MPPLISGPPQFVYRRRVEFAETDMAGIVHFSYFCRYMEEAEHAWFRSLGLKIMQPLPDGSIIGWPRVRASCVFVSPAFYEDQLDIGLRLARRGVKSLTMAFEIVRGADRIATGEVKTVCCQHPPGQPFHSIAIPENYQSVLVEAAAAPGPETNSG
jgi:acyl-CoA thioester hydrolase